MGARLDSHFYNDGSALFHIDYVLGDFFYQMGSVVYLAKKYRGINELTSKN